jgi:hypothetical protein
MKGTRHDRNEDSLFPRTVPGASGPMLPVLPLSKYGVQHLSLSPSQLLYGLLNTLRGLDQRSLMFVLAEVVAAKGDLRAGVNPKCRFDESSSPIPLRDFRDTVWEIGPIRTSTGFHAAVVGLYAASVGQGHHARRISCSNSATVSPSSGGSAACASTRPGTGWICCSSTGACAASSSST